MITANVYLAFTMPTHYSKTFHVSFHIKIYEVGTILIPIFQMRKLKHREVKQLAQSPQLGNSRAPEPEHSATIPYCISVIKVQENEGGNGRHGKA